MAGKKIVTYLLVTLSDYTLGSNAIWIHPPDTINCHGSYLRLKPPPPQF